MTFAEMGSAFFEVPSDETLRQVVFEPSAAPKAWVIFVNYILSAAPATNATEIGLANMWRLNSRLALESASVFLESSKINIQAFMLLAFHGEDFAFPNISWMLTSHACRQAEALGIHIPLATADFNAQQQQLCLFWALFITEKWCSLAFGRQVFMPTSLYSHVPLPNFAYLTTFKPHLHDLSSEHWKELSSTFGAHVFFQNIELSKLAGTVLECLAYGQSPAARDELKSRLDHWYETTNQVNRSSLAHHWRPLLIVDPADSIRHNRGGEGTAQRHSAERVDARHGLHEVPVSPCPVDSH